MRQFVTEIEIRTSAREFSDVTEKVRAWTREQGVQTGLLTLFLRHTSASLLIQENADPDVLADLGQAFERLAPEQSSYRHRAEGPDDMPSHIKAALTQTSLSIPLVGGDLALGTWQAVYLLEHRAAPHRRALVLHLIGA